MIRPFTLICVLLAGGSGLYLYQSKHRAQMLDREIGRTVGATAAIRDRIGLLKAEWALLNEPERLQDLAQQHLALKPLAPAQYVALADLGQRLPAPLPPGALLPPDDPQAVAELPASLGPVAVAPGAVMPSAATVSVASASAIPVPATRAARAAPPVQPARPVPRRTPDAPAAADPAPLAPAIATPLVPGSGPAPKPFTPIVPLGPAIPLVPRPTLVQRVVATAPAPVPFAFPSAPPVVASALGGAVRVALPPPVPVR